MFLLCKCALRHIVTCTVTSMSQKEKSFLLKWEMKDTVCQTVS